MSLPNRDKTMYYRYIEIDPAFIDWKVKARNGELVAAMRSFRERSIDCQRPGLYEVKELVEEYIRRHKSGSVTESNIEVTRVTLSPKVTLVLTKEKGLTTITYTSVEAEQLYDNEVPQAIANAILAYR